MPLRVEPDGTLVLAGTDPGVDLAAAGRPARLVMAPADAIDAVLGIPLPPEPPAAPAPAPETRPERAEALAHPSADKWDAVMQWPSPAPRRRAWPWALLGLALLGLALAAALLAGRQAADAPEAGLVQSDLPAGVRAELPAEAASREDVLAAACDGRPAVVAAPLEDVPCTLSPAAEATVGATILLAPGGGCIAAAQARRLVATLRDRPDRQPSGDARPVAIRPDDGGACVTADATTLRAGLYPLTSRAIVVVRPAELGSRAAARLAGALRSAEQRAPVTTLVATRAVS